MSQIFKNFNSIELKQSELEGRYLIATRDIDIGEDLLKCKSYFAITSDQLKKQSCFNCIKLIKPIANNTTTPPTTIQPIKCNQCNEIWYCSDKCKEENYPKHLHYECKFYKKLRTPKLTKEKLDEPETTFTEIRMIVGLLSRYYNDNLINNKYIPTTTSGGDGQDDDNDDNNSLTNTLDDVFDLVENVVTIESNEAAKIRIDQVTEFITNLFKLVLKEHIDELVDKIRKLIHKTRCNQFGIWSKTDKCIGIAVSPSSSYFNHSCVPNCTDVRNGSNMTFKSLYPIKKGDKLSISYIELDQITQQRLNELKYGYHFNCNCQRCNNTNPIEFIDSIDNWISKFYCTQNKCSGLYYSKLKVEIFNNNNNEEEDKEIKNILLSCSNCNHTKNVNSNYFIENRPPSI